MWTAWPDQPAIKICTAAKGARPQGFTPQQMEWAQTAVPCLLSECGHARLGAKRFRWSSDISSIMDCGRLAIAGF